VPKRDVALLIWLLTLGSAFLYAQQAMEPAQTPKVVKPAEVGTFSCSADTLYANDTLVLHLPTPHGCELILRTPTLDKIFFLAQSSLIHDDSGPFSFLTGEEFLRRTELRIAVQSFKCRPYIAGSKREIVFSKSGKYEFEMANNLEDDSGIRGDTVSVIFINKRRSH